MNPQKLLRRTLDNPRGLRFAKPLKLAETFGFRLDRINGSHHILKRAGIHELLILQNVGGMANHIKSGSC